MEVKIGDRIHHASVEPIMVTFNERDKKNILMMLNNHNMRYCAAPGHYTKTQIKKFMGTHKNVKRVEGT